MLNWFIPIAAAFLIIFCVFSFWLIPVKIEGNSMSPLLKGNEIVLLDKAEKYILSPGRGKIISFYDSTTNSLLMKRIVALSGETVEIVSGIICINGLPLDESSYMTNPDMNENMALITVPEGYVFVLSDNREDKADSRTPLIGCISLKDIHAVLRARIYPFPKINLFI